LAAVFLTTFFFATAFLAGDFFAAVFFAGDFFAAFFAVFLTATSNSLCCGTHVINVRYGVKATPGSQAIG
jgi:hypothetical protein